MKPHVQIHTLRQRKLLLSVAAAALFSPLSISATPAAEDAANKQPVLEEIIVSARQREESLQDLSLSVTALTGTALERAGVQNVRDFEYMVPNLVFGNTGTDGETFVGIRGVGDFSRNIGFDTRVGVYIDGVFVGQSLAINQALADISRIEVLRGPQGTLFGKNTSSGVINIITNKPSDEFSGSASVSYGNLNAISGTAILNAPIAGDKAAMRITWTGKHRDGYVKNLFNGKDLLSEKYHGGRAQLRLTPSDRLDINITADYGVSRPNILFLEPTAEVGFGGYSLAPNPREVSQDVDLKDKLDGYGFSASGEYTFANDYVLTSITGYRHAERLTVSDEDASPLDFLYVDRFEDGFNQFSQELRIASPKGEKFDYVIGLYFYNQNASSVRSARSGVDFLGDLEIARTDTSVDTKAYAAFANGNVYLTDAVSVNAGVRVTHEKKERRL